MYICIYIYIYLYIYVYNTFGNINQKYTNALLL